MESLEGMKDKSIPTTKIPGPYLYPSYGRATAALTGYIISRRRMAMDSRERMRNKSIPTTIPCRNSPPSYQRAGAALTSYIINRRGMAMDSLQRMRDKSI